MQIQLNSDNHVVGSEALASRVESELRTALDRFSDRITRVEVHINDVNSDKGGSSDKRCMIEARAAGQQPISVEHQAATITLAMSGATDKLVRAFASKFGKLRRSRRGGTDHGMDET